MEKRRIADIENARRLEKYARNRNFILQYSNTSFQIEGHFPALKFAIPAVIGIVVFPSIDITASDVRSLLFVLVDGWNLLVGS